jgi:hypothetical protein
MKVAPDSFWDQTDERYAIQIAQHFERKTGLDVMPEDCRTVERSEYAVLRR